MLLLEQFSHIALYCNWTFRKMAKSKKKNTVMEMNFFLVDFAYFDYSSGIWYNRLKFSLLS